MRSRLKWLDAIKGLAIVMVVVHHVCDGLFNSGAYPFAPLEITVRCLQLTHIPLLMMASGYAFSYSYEANGEIERMPLGKQVLNLCLLYLIYSVIRYFARLLFMDKTNHAMELTSILYIGVFAMDELWYLYSLIIIYLVVSLLLWIHLEKVLVPVFLACIIYAMFFLQKGPTILRAIQFAPYFLMGMYYVRNRKVIQKRERLIVCCAELLLAICLAWIKICWLNGMAGNIISVVVSVLVCDASFGGLSYINENSEDTVFFMKGLFNTFAFLGKNSLAIYLFHLYFTAGGRSLAVKNNIGIWPAALLLSLAGVFVPILIKRILIALRLDTIAFRPVELFHR